MLKGSLRGGAGYHAAVGASVRGHGWSARAEPRTKAEDPVIVEDESAGRKRARTVRGFGARGSVAGVGGAAAKILALAQTVSAHRAGLTILGTVAVDDHTAAAPDAAGVRVRTALGIVAKGALLCNLSESGYAMT
jgi:hypothetical protein